MSRLEASHLLPLPRSFECTTATKYRALRSCMCISYVVGQEQESRQCYSVNNIDTILTWMYIKKTVYD
jgi:hypothetical protein